MHLALLKYKVKLYTSQKLTLPVIGEGGADSQFPTIMEISSGSSETGAGSTRPITGRGGGASPGGGH